jgi:hypothetical protein
MLMPLLAGCALEVCGKLGSLMLNALLLFTFEILSQSLRAAGMLLLRRLAAAAAKCMPHSRIRCDSDAA